MVETRVLVLLLTQSVVILNAVMLTAPGKCGVHMVHAQRLVVLVSRSELEASIVIDSVWDNCVKETPVKKLFVTQIFVQLIVNGARGLIGVNVLLVVVLELKKESGTLKLKLNTMEANALVQTLKQGRVMKVVARLNVFGLSGHHGAIAVKAVEEAF